MGNGNLPDIVEHCQKRQLPQLSVSQMKRLSQPDGHLSCPFHMLFGLVIALRQRLRQRIQKGALLGGLVHHLLGAHALRGLPDRFLHALCLIPDHGDPVLHIRIDARIVGFPVLLLYFFKKTDCIFLLCLGERRRHIAVFHPCQYCVCGQIFPQQIGRLPEQLIAPSPAEHIVDQTDAVGVTYHHRHGINPL